MPRIIEALKETARRISRQMQKGGVTGRIVRPSMRKMPLLLPGLLAVAGDYEIVLHRKYMGPVGAKVRKVFIGFVVTHTLQRDVAVFQMIWMDGTA